MVKSRVDHPAASTTPPNSAGTSTAVGAVRTDLGEPPCWPQTTVVPGTGVWSRPCWTDLPTVAAEGSRATSPSTPRLLSAWSRQRSHSPAPDGRGGAFPRSSSRVRCTPRPPIGESVRPRPTERPTPLNGENVRPRPSRRARLQRRGKAPRRLNGRSPQAGHHRAAVPAPVRGGKHPSAGAALGIVLCAGEL